MFLARLTRALKTNYGSIQAFQVKAMCSASAYNYDTLKVSKPKEFVFHVEMNRPEKMNAMNLQFWKDLKDCFTRLSAEPECRAVVISAAGKLFTAGIDFSALASIGSVVMDPDKDAARRARAIAPTLEELQASFTSLEKCTKPVIVAIHNACVGGGVDMICACDIRFCTRDAWFQVKEVDVGLAADLGTLQRLPKIVGNDSLVRELTYTARKLPSEEAQAFGLVSRVFENKEELIEGSLSLAEQIAAKSPVAVQTSKAALVYARDHSVSEGLNQVSLLNQAMLQSEDVMKAANSMMSKEAANFSKL